MGQGGEVERGDDEVGDGEQGPYGAEEQEVEAVGAEVAQRGVEGIDDCGRGSAGARGGVSRARRTIGTEAKDDDAEDDLDGAQREDEGVECHCVCRHFGDGQVGVAG